MSSELFADRTPTGNQYKLRDGSLLWVWYFGSPGSFAAKACNIITSHALNLTPLEYLCAIPPHIIGDARNRLPWEGSHDRNSYNFYCMDDSEGGIAALSLPTRADSILVNSLFLINQIYRPQRNSEILQCFSCNTPFLSLFVIFGSNGQEFEGQVLGCPLCKRLIVQSDINNLFPHPSRTTQVLQECLKQKTNAQKQWKSINREGLTLLATWLEQPASVVQNYFRNTTPPSSPQPTKNENTPPSPEIKKESSTSHGIASFTLRLAGVTHDGRPQVIRTLHVGQTLWLHREPNNPHDRNAINVKTEGEQSVGFIPREVAAQIAPRMDKYGMAVPARVRQITGGGTYALGVEVEFTVLG